MLYQPSELEQVFGRSTAAVTPAIAGVSIDTRTLQQGDLFVALQDVRDGHEFVEAAFKAGAGAALVSHEKGEALRGFGPLFTVDDPLAALTALGQAARARAKARRIAVTGSVGKTSTKEMLRLVLSRQGATHASVASYNNHWGVPLTLARMPRETKFGVFEIGMSASFEILPLTAQVLPEVAIVTTVEPVHLAQFPSLAAIADAKGEIFSGLQAGGVAILNRDNPSFDRLKAHVGASKAGRIVTFGAHEGADYKLVRADYGADSSKATVTIYGRQNITFEIGAPGQHMVMNALAVLAAVEAIGGDVELAAETLSDFRPAQGRGARIPLKIAGGEALLVDESYNANPASMRAALQVLGSMPVKNKGRRIAVLGDMLELGAEAAALHKGLAAPIAAYKTDVVFACGASMRNLWEALPMAQKGAYAETSAALSEVLNAALRADDVIMIKGSLGSKMGLIVKNLNDAFGSPPQAQQKS